MKNIFVVGNDRLFCDLLQGYLSNDAEFKVYTHSFHENNLETFLRKRCEDAYAIIFCPDIEEKIVFEILQKKYFRYSMVIIDKYNGFIVKKFLKNGANAIHTKTDNKESILNSLMNFKENIGCVSDIIKQEIVREYLYGVKKNSVEKISYLSKREIQIISLIMQDKTSKQIASHLGLSVRTIDVYKTKLLKKLNVQTLAGVALFAFKEGLYSYY